METKDKWLSVIEAAEFLRTTPEEVEEMVRRRQVPYSVLPVSGTPIFSMRRLDMWLQSREVQEVAGQAERSDTGLSRRALLQQIKKRVRAKTVDRSRYVNLYSGTRVYAQLHEPSERTGSSYDGICIAVPEATSDRNIPDVQTLNRVDIEDLYGYWKANRDWLEGNGQRFTQSRALAFHVPLQLAQDPTHPAWSEVDALLEYALRKLQS